MYTPTQYPIKVIILYVYDVIIRLVISGTLYPNKNTPCTNNTYLDAYCTDTFYFVHSVETVELSVNISDVNSTMLYGLHNLYYVSCCFVSVTFFRVVVCREATKSDVVQKTQ